MWQRNGLKIHFLSSLGQVWKRRDVLSECQELHSLLPNSWGAKRYNPDELLWGDHSQSLGEYRQIMFVCGQLDNLQSVLRHRCEGWMNSWDCFSLTYSQSCRRGNCCVTKPYYQIASCLQLCGLCDQQFSSKCLCFTSMPPLNPPRTLFNLTLWFSAG